MTWREAFIAQAKHDYSVFNQLNQQRGNFADQLHYLQMATEKLARGFLIPPTDCEPPPMTHAGVVRMFQHLKGNPVIRRRLGYGSSAAFSAYIDSLLNMAGRIQALAPAIAGLTQPNPEYPWLDKRTNAILVPFQFDFVDLQEFKNVRAAKFLKLFSQLISVIDS